MKKILIISGIHGDEPSGPKIINSFLKLLKKNERFAIDVISPINHWGLKHNKRTNSEGKDLNRYFFDKPKKDEPKECKIVRKKISRIKKPYDLLISLHEGPRKTFCLYDTGFGENSKMIKNLLKLVKNNGVELFTGVEDAGLKSFARRGYIRVEPNDPSPTLEEYLSRNKIVKRVLTIEIPGRLLLNKKIDLCESILKTIFKNIN